MAKLPTTTPMCDTHDSDVAQALCLNHRRLMCFSCALKEATSKECVVKEIRELDENNSLLLRCLLMRQCSSRKERLIAEHEKKTAEVKKDLEQKVMDVYDKLNNRLKQMKDDCMKSLDKGAQTITESNAESKQRLLTFQKAINETIDKLSVESMSDTGIERQLNEMETDILQNIEDKQCIVEGIFKENSKLVETIMQPKAILSVVSLIEQGHYAVINDKPESQEDPSQKLQVYASSDEILDESEKATEPSNDTKDENLYSQHKNGKEKARDSNTSDQSTDIPIDGQKGHGGKGFFARLFSKENRDKHQKERNKSETKEDEPNRQSKTSQSESLGKIYADSAFSEAKGVKPKHLINKTVYVKELKKNDFSSALKFSKLIYLGDGYIGMMSETHSSVFVVGLDGKLFGKKTFKGGKITMCDMGKYVIATVNDPGVQINKFKVSEEGLTTVASVVASEQLSDITGFDFDVSSSTFAISTTEKVIVLDKAGKTVKIIAYNSSNNSPTNELATLYNFEMDCLYILNKSKNTLKMFSLKKKSFLWKRKIDGSDFTPKCMCLSEDKLCITCGSSIALFSAASGEPLFKNETKDLLEDCLGLCVIDSVIVFSSGSDDFETSAKLAYISI